MFEIRQYRFDRDWDSGTLGRLYESEWGEYVRESDFARVQEAVMKIAGFTEHPLWNSDKDAAADAMIRVAQIALGIIDEPEDEN